MPLNRNKLYVIILTVCAAGYAWLYFHINAHFEAVHSVGVCLVKQFTGIPCPSCGTTRAVAYLIHGEWREALLINPFGFVVACIMFFAPLWVLIDFITGKQTLFALYREIEERLKKPIYALPLILLVIINWAWNIFKGL